MTLRRSIFWSLSQQFGMMVLQTVNMVVIARLLTPEEIGVFVIALSIVTIIQALREMGLTNYLIREPVLHQDTIRATFGMSIALCTVIGLGLLLIRSPLETWMGTPGLSQVMGPVVLVILIFPIEQPAMALIRREMRFEALHHASLIAKFAGVVTSIGLALMGYSTMALVWGLVAEAVLRMVLLSRAESRHLRLGPSLRGWRPLLGFGVWTSGASLVWQTANEGTKILVGAMLGAAPAAILDRASRLPTMVRTGLFMPLSRVLLSSFSEDLRTGRSIATKVERLTAITSGMIWPIFAIFALLSQEIVALVLGPQWTQSAMVLPWLLLAQALQSLLPQPDQILVPFGHVRRLFILRVIQMTLTMITAVIALNWGLMGFAMSRPPNAILLMIATWFAIAPYMGVKAAALMRGHLRSGVMTLATAVPVAAWKLGLGDGSYLVLFAMLVLSVVFGLSAGIALHHPLAAEIRRTTSWLITRRNRAASK